MRNGTFIDAAEKAAVESLFGPLPAIFPKRSLGDALGASALMQLICATRIAAREGPRARARGRAQSTGRRSDRFR